MTRRSSIAIPWLCCFTLTMAFASPGHADGDLRKVNHIVFMMQENRSFDNYFGALPYVPGGPYHPCKGKTKRSDHQCVDGLTCRADSSGELTCSNFNVNDAGEKIFAFHDSRICAGSGLAKRFLASSGRGRHHAALTLRDASADTLEDLFDFDHSPSLDATIPTAPPPSAGDEGCS
jgi:phosphoesterase family protein